MNRLQKKCLIAVAGTHLLAVVALLCSGFIRPSPQPGAKEPLEYIPSKAIDTLLNSGVRNPQPPPPTPIVQPQQQPQPEPPTPRPPVKVVEPTPALERIQPNDLKPVDPTEAKPPKHEVKVDLTKKITRTPVKETDNSADEAEKQAQEQKKLRDQRNKVLRSAINNLKNNFSSATEVNMPGESSASYAYYGAIVVSVYHHAWVAPEHMATDSAVVSFSVTISKDGHVIACHIESPSGDPNVDNAVQHMLDRVPFIHEFPEDTTDRERTYHIDFNATRTNIQ